MEKVKKNKSPAFMAWFTVEWNETVDMMRKQGVNLKRIEIVPDEKGKSDD